MTFSFKRLVRLAILAGLPFGQATAQSSVTSPYVPSVIPPSPNAASLMKFTDVPVSPYTGTADVSIPIYTIKAKGITVPIAVAYHTGGIRLEEEAGWVGLGWALNAGGMISRTIMGKDDFGTQGNIYLTNDCPQLSGDITFDQTQQQLKQISPYFFDFWCNYQVQTTNGIEDFWPAFTTAADPYDMEPDIFSYNFPGHSGKFILTRAGSVVMQKQENIRIQFQGSGGGVTFTVTDEQGNTFYFTTLEATSISPYTSTSSWLLTKIVTQQQDSILFNYVSGGTTASSLGDVHQTFANYCTAVDGFTSTNAVVPQYFNQTLQSIDFPNGHLQFNFDSARNDLFGAYKLDSVLIYSKNASGTLTYLKQDNFYYSYFNPTLGASSGTPYEYYRLKLDSVKESSGATVLPPYSFTYNNPDPGVGTQKHSYNIDHWGYYNGASNSVLIPTMSVSYNPIVNEIGAMQLLQYSGANRQPSWPAMQIFSLQQIAYPTGGKTVLTYQPNDYDYTNSIRGGAPEFQYMQTVPITDLITATNHGYTSGTIDLTNVYPIISDGQPGSNVTFNVTFRYQKNDTFPYSNYSGKIYFSMAGFTWDIHSATCQSNGPVCTASLSLPFQPGVYNWTAYIDPALIDTTTTFAGIYVNIQFNETQQVYNLLQNGSNISPASGLRIQTISNYKDAGTIASQKVYGYSYMDDKQQTGQPQQYSYGRIMSIPSYVRYWITPAGGGYCTALALYSSTMSSLTSVIQGNIVGYDQVTETNVDPLTGQDIGQTVYQYHNNSDTAIRFAGYGIPGIFNMGDNLNGLQTAKIDYANKDGVYYKVDETDYNYYTTNRSVYFSPKYQIWQNQGTGGMGCVPDTGVEQQTSAWFYPSIKSERVLLSSKVTLAYQQGDTTQAVASTQTNYYDNPVHYQVTRMQTLDSKGNTLTTQLRYPQDYIPPGGTVTGNTILDSLIGRNMVSEPIEKVDNLYYSGSPTDYVTGAQLNTYRIITANNNTAVPDRTYKLDLQAPVTDFTPFSVNGNSVNMDSRNQQMVSFDQYDGNNNLQQYTSTDQNPVTIIWDYNHVYPIAQVKNAAASDVAATSFEADASGGWNVGSGSVNTSAGFTGNSSYALTGTLSKAGLNSATTYVVSYWVMGTSNPLSVTGTVSGYPMKGKTVSFNGEQWTYYESKIKGVTTATISGNGTVDEIRLYPANAQMTTYTYSPLVGTTSQCDVDNRVTYYFYDGLGRLKYLKDQDGNIIKTFDYHYQGQTSN